MKEKRLIYFYFTDTSRDERMIAITEQNHDSEDFYRIAEMMAREKVNNFFFCIILFIFFLWLVKKQITSAFIQMQEMLNTRQPTPVTFDLLDKEV